MGFDMQGAEQGASMGAQSGNPWLAVGAGILGGFLGKKPSYTPAQKLQMQIAQQLQSYANGVPLSDPGEAAALAQQRGMLGQEQQQATGQVLGSLNPYAQTNVTDLMRNLSSSQAGERGALDIQALMQSLAAHKQALLNSAQVAGSVGPKGEPAQGQDFPALFANLAYQYSQQKALKQPGAQSGASNPFLNTVQPPGAGVQPAGAAGSPFFGGVGAQSLPGAPQAAPKSGMLNAFGGMIGGMRQSSPTAGVSGMWQSPDELGKRLQGVGG